MQKARRTGIDDLATAGDALTDEHLRLAAGAIMRQTSGACTSPGYRDGRVVDTIVEFHPD